MTPTTDPDANASITGTVTYRERLALTPGAIVAVHLRDTSLMDVASVLIAEQVITNPGQVPIAFEVHYNEDDINPRNTYSISARITEADGRLAFINDTGLRRDHPGQTHQGQHGAGDSPAPPDPTGEWNEENSRRYVEEEVEVIGAEVVEYQPEVILLVAHYQSTVENCVRRGSQSFEVSGSDIFVTITLTVPPATPWAIPCDEEVVEVEEVVRFGDALDSGQTYRVIVNGTEATTFTVPPGVLPLERLGQSEHSTPSGSVPQTHRQPGKIHGNWVDFRSIARRFRATDAQCVEATSRPVTKGGVSSWVARDGSSPSPAANLVHK